MRSMAKPFILVYLDHAATLFVRRQGIPVARLNSPPSEPSGLLREHTTPLAWDCCNEPCASLVPQNQRDRFRHIFRLSCVFMCFPYLSFQMSGTLSIKKNLLNLLLDFLQLWVGVQHLHWKKWHFPEKSFIECTARLPRVVWQLAKLFSGCVGMQQQIQHVLHIQHELTYTAVFTWHVHVYTKKTRIFNDKDRKCMK